MVFVLQTATELAILKSAGQDKTTFPAFFDEKISRTLDKVPVKPTTGGKIFNFIYNLLPVYENNVGFNPVSARNLKWKIIAITCQSLPLISNFVKEFFGIYDD